MQPWQREAYVSRIISGSVRCTVSDHRDHVTPLLIKSPSRDQRYLACEVFAQVYEESQGELLSDDGLLSFMLDQGLWDEEKEELLEKLPKDIETGKLELYKAAFKPQERESLRKYLTAAKTKYGEVLNERHSHLHLSCSGAANIAKARYLLGCSLYRPNGRPVFADDSFWDQPSTLLDNVMSFYHQHRLEEPIYRDLARHEPWRGIWSTRKVEGVLFGVPACDLSEEQRHLICWSNLYENVYQHPECPQDFIIEDDDMFDGWMIEQRKKRDEAQKQTLSDDTIGNERIRNSQEVFQVAGSVEEARSIIDQNSDYSKGVLKQRFDYLRKHGEVNEMDMPDTKQRLRKEIAERFRQSLRS